MNRKLFDLPKPILIQEARDKSKNLSVAFMGKRNKSKPGKARPLIPNHVCIKEGNCEICRWFINMEDRERSFINGK